MGDTETLPSVKGGSLKRLWSWAKAQFSPALTAFLATLFVATFVWVLFAAVIWPVQNAHRFRLAYRIDETRTLEIWGPSILPAEETGAEIEFTLHQTDISNTQFVLTVTLPAEIILSSENDNAFAHQVELHFTGALADETQTLSLVNARTVAGLGILEREILLKGQAAEEEAVLEESIPLGVEPTGRAVLRRYGGGGSEVPLFPLVTLFISVAGWVYQEIRRRKEEEDKRREEEEKQEEKARQEAASTLSRLRQEIKSGQIEQAAQTLEALRQSKMEDYLEKRDLRMVAQLLALAKGNFEGIEIQSSAENWLEEAAAALAYAAENNPTSRLQWEALLRKFPVEKLREELRSRLETARTVLGANTPLQGWEWPPSPVKVEIPSFNTPLADLKKNPFPFPAAEDEQGLLFAQETAWFWAEHSLFNILKNSRGAFLVQGEEGSGKSALALALGNYRRSVGDRAFSCYLAGVPNISQIRHALAEQLLSFIEHLPSHLALLGDEQRRLLAYTLLTELSRPVVLGRIEYASQPVHQKWLNEVSADLKPIWEAETVTHLRLLRQAVLDIDQPSFSETQWWLALQSCLRSLGFDNSIYVVLDAGREFSWGWYEEVILPHRHVWADFGVHSITFCSPPLPARKLRNLDGLHTAELKWPASDLKKMIEHRWQNIYPLLSLRSVFAENALDTMLQRAAFNPRPFIVLWNEVFSHQKGLPISVQDIRNAAECLGWK
jgi:hypothetical protein